MAKSFIAFDALICSPRNGPGCNGYDTTNMFLCAVVLVEVNCGFGATVQIKEWRKITAYSTEQYHLITGPVLGCWQVIKDCASRVPNEADPQAGGSSLWVSLMTLCVLKCSTYISIADLAGHSRPGEDRSAASDEPDTTISIVKAILPNNRWAHRLPPCPGSF